MFTPSERQDFAQRYAAAWSSQNAASVASFFEESASLRINAAAPSIGRAAISAAAQSFMTAFPDLLVTLDQLTTDGPYLLFHWTLTGHHTSTGNFVRIRGYEQWTLSGNNLIAQSQGHFDESDYQHQLAAASGTA